MTCAREKSEGVNRLCPLANVFRAGQKEVGVLAPFLPGPLANCPIAVPIGYKPLDSSLTQIIFLKFSLSPSFVEARGHLQPVRVNLVQATPAWRLLTWMFWGSTSIHRGVHISSDSCQPAYIVS
jgi:hypothetical protein